MALTRKAQEWVREDRPTEIIVSNELQANVTYQTAADDEGEEDWLDLLALQEEAMKRINESATRIAAATQQLGTRVTEKGQELQAIVAEPNPSPSRARRLINDVADDLDIFARALESEIPIFRGSWSMVMDRLPRLFTVWSEIEPKPDTTEGTSRARQALVDLSETMAGTMGSLTGLREAIASLPRLTSQYKKASRRSLASMDDLLAEFAKVRAFVADFSP